MSGLADLSLRTEYRKGRDDIAEEFYLPCMSVANRYDRAVGFFNSAIYVIAWPSLRSFVERQGQMRMICSPVLPPQDIEALETGYSQRFDVENAEKLRDEIRYMLSTPYLFKPAIVLASLIALDVVDIRIAFMKRTARHERLFHDKLGLFHDPFENTVAFKGSMNETWSGLSADGNLESVDVYLSWEHEREAKRVEENRTYFDQLWENKYESGGVAVKKFPDIARDELLSAADTKRWPEILEEICREIEAAQQFQAPKASGGKVLRPHQESALTTWEGKGRRGILEHATGSGKTFTALCAMRNALKRQEVPLVLVPSELLLTQWHKEIVENLGDLDTQILRCGAGFTRWRDDALLGAWTRAGSPTPRIVLSTMQTAVMPEFRNALRQGGQLFMVADEVHRIGSTNHLHLLDLDTGPRLGLSATPRRAGDPAGTGRIFDYFEGIVPPPFTLKDAIKSNALTPYIYHVRTVLLSEAEQEQWDQVTKRVRRLSAENAAAKDPKPGADDQIKRLLIERGRILKQATAKAGTAAEIVTANYESGHRWIVYCDDLAQMNTVKERLISKGLPVLEYHSAMVGDKEQTLRLFEANGGIVVSIRCLDEGVDIPSVSHALILASSKNPREFIQRRGRVLRTAEKKSVAHIYDVLVMPLAADPEEKEENKQQEDPRLNILGGELSRAVEFGKWALNPAAITDLERIALRYSKDYQALLGAGYEDEED
jgi:superfamily II DNA or RNA helicase